MASGARISVAEFLFRYGIVAGLVILCLGFAIFTPEHLFVQKDNIINVANQISINCILAVGMTFVIITAGIDLSVGSVLAVAGVLVAMAMGGATGAVAVCIGLATGLAVGGLAGWFNGACVANFGLPPFIATLAMMLVARGAAFVISHGQPVYNLPDTFRKIGQSPELPIPIPVFIMAAVVAVAWVLLSKTTFGRYVLAIGGNEEAARLSGIAVARVKALVYAMAGALAGLAGVILASKLGSGDPKSGQFYELDAIAAVVVGGTSLMGGRGSIFGTVIGALIIGVMNNGLSLLEVDQYWQWIVKGGVILTAVLLDQTAKR
jgi:ribose/xylose/arabinose/galactoside ABC-type transport system permease subunit